MRVVMVMARWMGGSGIIESQNG